MFVLSLKKCQNYRNRTSDGRRRRILYDPPVRELLMGVAHLPASPCVRVARTTRSYRKDYFARPHASLMAEHDEPHHDTSPIK